jgi:ketosteroid isomerase-like protein
VAAVLAGCPGARAFGGILAAVSDQNVEIVRRFHEAFNRDGWEAMWRVADPNIEFHEPPEQPGASVFQGVAAVREGVERSWGQNWIEQRSVVERLVDLGDSVLLLTTEHLRGRDGIEVMQPSGSIITLRDGKIVRFQAYWDQRAALDAAGLRE